MVNCVVVLGCGKTRKLFEINLWKFRRVAVLRGCGRVLPIRRGGGALAASFWDCSDMKFAEAGFRCLQRTDFSRIVLAERDGKLAANQ